MSAANPWPELHQPLVVVAFSGWSDAADSATETIEHLALCAQARDVLEIDLQDFMDFQDNRPHTILDEDGTRHIEWPTARIRVGRIRDADIVLVDSDEPNLRWRVFAQDLAGHILDIKPSCVLFLGALLADVPHTRTLPVTGTTTDPVISARCEMGPNTYEGPTGLLGVLAVECISKGLTVTSLWATVPHYLSHSPCPPAVLGLLNAIEDVAQIALPQGDYAEQTRAWQRRCDELAEDDEDLRGYITALEEQHDAHESPEATGEAIAREFERYLRRRGEN